ncbi:hypothetical protein ACET3Z_011345 [Daucus carota]
MAMNHTLQRSSYSFRRQGSSGRIWNDNYSSKSCELQSKRKVQESRFFSCDLNKMQRSSMSLQRHSSVALQRQPSIPLQADPSRKQRIQKARPRRCECLAFFRLCVN